MAAGATPGLDPREIKQVFQDAWKRSDNLASFRHALEEHGYFLAKGDRRGFVALDIHGEPFAIARWVSIKTKEVAQRLGDPDALPSVEEVRQSVAARMKDELKARSRDSRKKQEDERAPLNSERDAITAQHRDERQRLHDGLDTRWRKEAVARASRLRSGIRAVWDPLAGQASVIRRQNERESYQCLLRNKAQREALFKAQSKERRELQARIDALAKRQRQERRDVARTVAALLRKQDPTENQTRIFRRDRDRGPSLAR